MKLIVTANKLNVRSHIPQRLPEPDGITGQVLKGHTFDGTLVTDPNLPDGTLGKWYQDTHGAFYWGGGVTVADDNSLSIQYNWIIKDYGIDTLWKATKGRGVKVAVIDTGLNYNHSNIRNKTNIEYFNIFTNSSNREDCLDTDGHGTYCAGMIGAQGPNVFGIAPEADLLIIKATVNKVMTCGALATAIDKAIELKASIISVSYSFFKPRADADQTDFNLLKEAVKNADDNRVLIVACTGDGGSGQEIVEGTFPASFPTSFAVAGSDQNKNLWTDSTLDLQTDILAPSSNISLLGLNNDIITDEGTSYSTPYIAGVCALNMSVSSIKDFSLLINGLKQQSTNKEQIQVQIQSFYSRPDVVITNLGVIFPSIIKLT